MGLKLHGVNFEKPKAFWRAQLRVKGKATSLGYFITAVQAARHRRGGAAAW